VRISFFKNTDRIIVLRGGLKVGERLKSQTTPDEIVKLIVDAEMLLYNFLPFDILDKLNHSKV